MAAGQGMAVPARLARAGEREVAALADLLAATEPGQSVHGARRRIKQLRSLLRLLRPVLGEEAFGAANGALREAADALAGHRRAEALVAAAARLAADGPAAGFWQELAQAHFSAHAAEGDPAAALAVARAAIGRAGAVLAAVPLAETGHAAIRTAFHDSYRRARKRLRQGLASGAAADLHEARKQVIHHLHQTRLLEPERERRLAALEALREVLGDLNDLDELEQLAKGAVPGGTDRKCLARARRRLLARAAKASERLFRRRPRQFAKRSGHAAEARSP